jgi:hypothetical protein
MSWIDWILNLAGWLLWLKWRSVAFESSPQPLGVSLVGTLKRAESKPSRRSFPLLFLAAILLLRAFFFWHLGSAMNWMPNLQLGAVVLGFRSDFLGRMLLYSLLSFGQLLAVFYLWLILLSALDRAPTAPDSFQKLVRLHLGWVARWPLAAKLLLPLVAGALVWALLQYLLVFAGLIPAPRSPLHLLEQALVMGLSAYLAWKFLVVGLLLLHLLNSYVYLGSGPVWSYVNNNARHLLRLLAWLPLHAGRVDLAPVAGIALVFGLAELGSWGLTRLFGLLPLGG